MSLRLDNEDLASPSAADLTGQVLAGRYRVLSQLEEGGMGTLYEAEHIRLRRRVAVKVVARHLLEDEATLARFQREVDIVSQLHHPNIVQVTDFDTTDDGQPFLVMELLSGETLAQRMARLGTLPLQEVVHINWQVASALAAAHVQGVVHRDLKPANIYLLKAPGQPMFVKLLDFGISKPVDGGRKITGQLELVGTPQYMAPEQALGKKIDARTDQFSLATIAYRMLTGRAPFVGERLADLLDSVINARFAPVSDFVSVPAEVDTVIGKAMDRDPERRFAKVSDFAVGLANATTDMATPVTFSTAPPPFGPTQSAPPGAGSSRPPLAAASSRPPLGPEPTRREQILHVNMDGIGQEATLGGVVDYLKAAEGALLEGNVALSLELAESAEAQAPPEAEALRFGERLDALYARVVGDLECRVYPTAPAPEARTPTPEQAFLLSRVDAGVTLRDVVDLSHLPRRATLKALAALVAQGRIRLESGEG